MIGVTLVCTLTLCRVYICIIACHHDDYHNKHGFASVCTAYCINSHMTGTDSSIRVYVCMCHDIIAQLTPG